MQVREHFFRDSLDASASLLLWAAHFFIVYIFVSLACESTLSNGRLFGRPLIESIFLMASLVFFLMAFVLLWRAIILCRRAPQRFLSLVRLGCAMLGGIGIVWTSVPMVILSACSR